MSQIGQLSQASFDFQLLMWYFSNAEQGFRSIFLRTIQRTSLHEDLEMFKRVQVSMGMSMVMFGNRMLYKSLMHFGEIHSWKWYHHPILEEAASAVCVKFFKPLPSAIDTGMFSQTRVSANSKQKHLLMTIHDSIGHVWIVLFGTHGSHVLARSWFYSIGLCRICFSYLTAPSFPWRWLWTLTWGCNSIHVHYAFWMFFFRGVWGTNTRVFSCKPMIHEPGGHILCMQWLQAPSLARRSWWCVLQMCESANETNWQLVNLSRADAYLMPCISLQDASEDGKILVAVASCIWFVCVCTGGYCDRITGSEHKPLLRGNGAQGERALLMPFRYKVDHEFSLPPHKAEPISAFTVRLCLALQSASAVVWGLSSDVQKLPRLILSFAFTLLAHPFEPCCWNN